MGGLRREDHILRQVKALAAVLARLAGLRLGGNLEEARAELEKTYASVLGSQSGLLRRVDSQTAAKLLGSPDRILALAQLLNEEAAQEPDAARGASLRQRALELGHEAARRDPASEAVREFLRGIPPKPDFSGTWRFNPGRSALQIPPPDATVFVIEHHEPALRITRTHIVAGRSDSFTLDLTTDGREVVVDDRDLRLRARAYWEGESLVFHSKVTRGGEEGVNFVRYTLNEEGRSFTAEESFRSGTLSYDNRWVLERA
ncbi:MAG TPA: hypothetical protein VID50_02530 [Candidatus Eisenbacteria bacterium]|jgi:hypothetical protein